MKKLFTLFFATIITGTAFAQIPNPGFETWDTASGGYLFPAGWDSADSLTSLASVLTCEQGNPGYAGNHYLKLTSKTVPGFGVAAGIALSGKLDFSTYLPKSGFAYTGRPTSLTGVWQYAPGATTDTGVAAIALTKWNTVTGRRDTVGAAYDKLPGSVTTWTPFTIDIYYFLTETPDTAEIYFSASGATTAVAGSYLYVDTLAFSGPTTGITAIHSAEPTISISPNPSQGLFNISVLSGRDESANVTVTNMLGEKIKELTVSTNKPAALQLDVATGVYFVNVVTSVGRMSEKIVIVK